MVHKQEETDPGALLGRGSEKNLGSGSGRHAFSSQPSNKSAATLTSSLTSLRPPTLELCTALHTTAQAPSLPGLFLPSRAVQSAAHHSPGPILTWPVSSPFNKSDPSLKFEGFLSHWGPDWEPTYIYNPN